MYKTLARWYGRSVNIAGRWWTGWLVLDAPASMAVYKRTEWSINAVWNGTRMVRRNWFGARKRRPLPVQKSIAAQRVQAAGNFHRTGLKTRLKAYLAASIIFTHGSRLQQQQQHQWHGGKSRCCNNVSHFDLCEHNEEAGTLNNKAMRGLWQRLRLFLRSFFLFFPRDFNGKRPKSYALP